MQMSDNEYFAGLTEVACYMSMEKDLNDFSAFSKFNEIWKEDDLTFGGYKLRTHVKLPELKDYQEESTLLKVTKPEIEQASYTFNYKKMVPISYSQELLRASFLNGDGINAFVSYVMTQVNNACQVFIYDEIINVCLGGSAKRLQILEDNSSDFTEAKINMNARRIAGAVRSMAFNKETPITDTVILCTPTAYARNFSNYELYTDPINTRVEVIVHEELNDDIIYVIPKQNIVFFYTLNFSGSFFDPSNLMINNFVHFWCCIDTDGKYEKLNITKKV